jgi:predicted DNA-binding transcriptional regulator AlpA
MVAPSTSAQRYRALPANLPPIGLRREAAAAYIGISPSKFDELVADGRMPRPKRIDGIPVWSPKKLEQAFEALPDDAPAARGWYEQ